MSFLSGSGSGPVGFRIRGTADITTVPAGRYAPSHCRVTSLRAMLHDVFDRPLRNLRLSVTDRCNIRCQYCMPEKEYVWLPKHDILHFEEISRLVDVFVQLGVDKVRLTGGEPLLRRDLPELVRALASK